MASSPRTPDRPRGSLLEVDSATRARGMSTSPRPNFTLRRDQLRKEEVRVLTLELSAWIASLLQSEDLREKLFESDAIQSGQLLYDVMTKLGAWPASSKFHANAKPGSFPARENIQAFVKLAIEYGVPKSLTIQPDDVLARKNLRDYLLFLMALARAAARKNKVPGPALLRAEAAVETVRAAKPFAALPALQPDADTLSAAVTEGLPAATESISADAVASARARLRASDAGQYCEMQIQQAETWLKGFCAEFKVPADSVPSRLVVSQSDENDVGTIGFNTPALGQLQSALVYSPAVNVSGVDVPEAIRVLSDAERAGVSLYVFLGDEAPRNIYYVTVTHGLPMVLNESSNTWEPFAQLIERHITGSASAGTILSQEPVPTLASRTLDLEEGENKKETPATNPLVLAAVGAVAFFATAAGPWVDSVL